MRALHEAEAATAAATRSYGGIRRGFYRQIDFLNVISAK